MQDGVIVFRNTGLDDDGHVAFAHRFGDLLDMRQYLPKGSKTRFDNYELTDVSNIDAETGEVIAPDSARAQVNNATAQFHADLSFSPRRASFSILRAHELPPHGHGGNTEFADTRTAFERLDDEVEPGLKEKLLKKDYLGAHSWHHMQKMGNPELLKDMDPLEHDMAKYKLVQFHEASNRMNLYMGCYMHHIEGPPEEMEELAQLQKKLMKHAEQEKYRMNVEWESPGDLLIWDNL